MKNTEKGSSLRRGFTAGLSAPYQAVYGRRARFSHPHQDFVALSWAKVGMAVRDAIESERMSIGKTAKSATRTGR